MQKIAMKFYLHGSLSVGRSSKNISEFPICGTQMGKDTFPGIILDNLCNLLT